MYPGSNNYNNQYSGYPNQQPSGAPIGFNVGQQGYVPGQPDFNASQGCPQYVAGVPNTAGQNYQAGQGQYYQQQPYGASNPAQSWDQNQGMGMNQGSYGGAYPPPGQQYNPEQNPPRCGVTYPPMVPHANQPGGQAYHPQPIGQQYNPDLNPGMCGLPYSQNQPHQPTIGGGSLPPGGQAYHPEPIGQHHNISGASHEQNVTTVIQPTGPAYEEVVKGTMRPHPNFNPEQDCNALRTAMKGIGTDEKAIIECLGRRTLDQRLEIKKTYKTMFGKDLIECLKSELSGDFCRAVVESLYDSAYYDAHSLHCAMAGAGTREEILTEILTSRTNEEIETIKTLYKKWFNKDLEKQVISETSGFYKRVLVSCLQANKKELTQEEVQKLRQFGPSAVVSVNQASQEAAELYNAGEKKMGTDEAIFIKIFASRNKYQLRATFEAYEKLSGHNIIRAIESEMSGDLASSLKAIAMLVMNEPLYFATRLYKAMKGAGTNDTTLIRVLLSRSEIDLDNIKKEFQKQFNKSLVDFVREDTSGDYQKYLMRFVEGN